MNPRTLCKLEGSRDGNGIDTDRLDVRHTLQSRVRILETVTGHRAHDGQARLEPASARAASRPATLAADAGSTKTPSVAAIRR